MDPDGLDPTSAPFHKTLDDFGGNKDLYTRALINFLNQREFIGKPGSTYQGYTNFDSESMMFTQITTPRELEYQIEILRYILRGIQTAETRLIYGHLLFELLNIRGEYLNKKRGRFSQPAIFWANRHETTGDKIKIRTGVMKPPTEWKAEINNYKGQENIVKTYNALEGLLLAGGRGSNRAGPRYRINLNHQTNSRVFTIPRGGGRGQSEYRQPAALPGSRTAAQNRSISGVATGGYGLSFVNGRWLRGSHGNAGLIPKQIADQLRGRSFKSFDNFRSEFWRKVASDPILSSQFSSRNVNRMLEGKAPIAHNSQWLGKRKFFEIHHAQPIQRGGGVYDLDNFYIVTPRYHKEILDPRHHY